MTDAVLPTPFHASTAMRNPVNAWTLRGSFTVPAHYGDPNQEALAARFSVAMADISANEDLIIEGKRAASFLATACGTPLADLDIGASRAVHWCAEGDGLRGYGQVSRLAEDDFLLRSADIDLGWFAGAAPRFGVSLRDATSMRGLLFLTGPFALAAMVAAGLEAGDLKEGQHGDYNWRGLAVTVFRRTRPPGYELSCRAEDAIPVFDRLMRHGPLLALRLMGEDGLQLLQLEAGLPLAHADFAPAREALAREPSPESLGFKGRPDRGDDSTRRVLAGIEWDGEQPAPFAPVFAGGKEVGRTLRSLYSPALRCAIALAQLSPDGAAVGSLVSMMRLESSGLMESTGRVVALPFL
jgi:glycine cleavage system aminomethyltransferase T